MASTYSTNLKLELIGTGDQSGTWGATTNTNLGTLLDQAIAGYATQAVTDSGVATVLTIPDGASSTGRNYVISLTGALTAARTVEVPALNKPYIFFNSTTGGFAVTVKVTGQTGVVIANGKKAIVYTNTTDVIEVANAPATEAGTQTLTNKTLTAPVIATIVNTGTLTLPTSTDTLVGRATTDTLTNKTLTAPVIATIVNTGTLTLPTSTDTLVGRATTDTLTNKTLTSPLIGTVIGGTSVSSSLTLQSTSGVGTSDSILFKVGNNGATTAMTVDTSGNVGIGTASPLSKFEVDVGRSTFSASSEPYSIGVRYNNTGGRFYVGAASASATPDMVFSAATGDERMRITNAGNVGIGSSTFNGVKTVVQGSQTGGAPQTSGTTQTYGLLRLIGTSFTSSLDFGTNGGNYAWIQSTDTSNLATNYSLAINPNGGNVGIGTSSPSYPLDVNGNVQIQSGNSLYFFSSSYSIRASTGLELKTSDVIRFLNGTTENMRIDSSGNVGIGTASPTEKLDVIGNSRAAIATSSDVYFKAQNSAGSLFFLQKSTSAAIYTPTSQPLIFDIAGERMRIDSSGNVGIGATANASAILDAQSTTKGVRFPNMTTTEKNAISSPAAGLVVFDTTLAKLCVYSGSAWQTITSV